MIDGGATAIASSVTDIGFADGSQGNVMVSGLGSQWDVNSILNIGTEGIGSLTVENGASVVVNSIATIGAFTSSDGISAILKGSGSTLE